MSGQIGRQAVVRRQCIHVALPHGTGVPDPMQEDDADRIEWSGLTKPQALDAGSDTLALLVRIVPSGTMREAIRRWVVPTDSRCSERAGRRTEIGSLSSPVIGQTTCHGRDAM